MTAVLGSRIEKYIKEYRVHSIVLFNIALYLELMTLYNPKYFLLFATLSSLRKYNNHKSKDAMLEYDIHNQNWYFTAL